MFDEDKLKRILNDAYNRTKKISNIKNVKEIKKIDLNNNKYVQQQIKKAGILDTLKNFKNIYFQQAEKINKSGKPVKFAGYIFKNKNGNTYVVNNLDKISIKLDKDNNIKEIIKLDDFIKNFLLNGFIKKDSKKNEENKNKNFLNQLYDNIDNLEKIFNRFTFGDFKSKIVNIYKVSLEDEDIIKDEKHKEFFEKLLKNIDSAEIYMVTEKNNGVLKDKKLMNKNFLIKLNDNFIIYKNDIYYTGDIEKANERLNEPAGTIVGILAAFGAENLVKGIKDFLEGKFTRQSQHIIANSLENALQQSDIDKLKENVKKFNINDKFLKTLNLNSITELTPVKMFYLFSQGKKLTKENLESLKNLDINKLRELYIIQSVFTDQYLINIIDNKNINIIKLLNSYDINDYTKNSKFLTYKFNSKYDMYNKNEVIYKSIITGKINNIKCD